MKKGSVIRVIGVGVIFTIISQLIHSIGSLLIMGFYTDPSYFPV